MTGFNSNIDQVVQKFQQVSQDARNIDFSEALIGGTNAARGKMSFRIFNKGLDAFNLPFGGYVGPKVIKKTFTLYEYKRVKAGRQIARKDEEFTGDLRRSIKVVKRQTNSVVCAIVNPKLAKIATYQEAQLTHIQKRPVVIWRLTEEENKFYRDNVSALLKQQYVRAINSK